MEIQKLIISECYYSVIDFGCGKGKLTEKINQMPNVTCVGYDPAIEKFSKYPEPAEFVIANDVLEHFDPHEVMLELRRLNRLALRGIYLNISCRPAVHLLPNGLNAHTCLYDWQDWIEMCNIAFTEKQLDMVKWHKGNNNVVLFYKRKEND